MTLHSLALDARNGAERTTSDAPRVDPLVQAALARRGVRIALFGNFGSPNLGNEGTLATMLAVLRQRRPDAQISCICPAPERARALHDLPALPIRDTSFASDAARRLDRVFQRWPGRIADLFRTIRRVRDFDVLIVPGTGLLDDFGERPLAMPYTLLAWSAAARLAGRPLCMVSIGAGPIRNPTSLRMMRAAARLARFRSYRDCISHEFASDIGIDTREDRVTPDLVFAMPLPPATPIAAEPRERPTIGLGVMAYDGWTPSADGAAAVYGTYVDKISAYARWLVTEGYRVRLLVGEASDQRAVDDVCDRLRSDLPGLRTDELVAETASSLSELMAQMRDTDCVVATRFHNVVCALKVGRPVISLGYAAKNDVLADEFGLGAFCQHVERFDVARLQSDTRALLADLPAYASRIAARTAHYERELADQFAALLGD